MEKEDLFKITRIINHSGIGNEKWDVYDFDYTVNTGSLFGTREDFELPAGRYVVSYVELEFDGEAVYPTYSMTCEWGGMVYFYLVG